IDADEVTGGLELTIKVRELPKLSAISFKGNKKIKTKDILASIGLETEKFISPNLIFEKKNEILSKYAEKGYFLTTVNTISDYTDDSSKVLLTYDISEGSKVKVEEVILTGNIINETSEVISKIRNRKRGFLLSSNYDRDAFPDDKDKIIEYLHSHGFLDAYLKSDSIAIDSVRNRMKVYFDIYEGPRYYFGKTEYNGNEIFPDEIINRVLKYKEREVFSTEKFEESVYEIYFLYQEKGHLHVQLMDDRSTKDSIINISFDVVEGLPSEVNLVKITGNTKTRERVIRREMAIRPGQVFHRSLLVRSVRNIMQLNYFGNVTPDIADLPSGDVDILIEVEEKPTGQISAGAGYSGQDKFVGTFGLGIPNFRGMGQNLSFNIDIGDRRNSYSLSFTEPWAFGSPTLIGGDLYYTNRRYYSDYTEGRRGGSIKIGRRLKWPDDYFSIYARYRLEDDRFYDFSDAYRDGNSHKTYLTGYYMATDTLTSLPVPDTSYAKRYGEELPSSLERFNEGWNKASTIQFTISRDSRDLPEFATTGSVISYTFAKTGGDLLGGYWKYNRHEFSYSKFIPIWGKLTLAGKIKFGAISSPDNSKILEFDRYSPGGTGYDGVVRGYDDGSLTPDTASTISIIEEYYTSNILDSIPDMSGEDSPDFISPSDTTVTPYVSKVRGKYMLVGNLELQMPLLENQLYALMFFDAGNSWLHRKDIKLNRVYRGYGFGFRLLVPGIGTIGFDFGYPMDDRAGQEKGWKPHFQIGTTFR
ncbi:MAG: outer membrane protein assembly factor BamA, partial [candidate division Zixibacteria bacterium]|nr:outer membrane protein assembly factor BamA [candidate division Zixibacteria bacterium]